MPDPNHLLNSRQMAAFVTDGYLRFDALVPNALNRAAMPELDGGLRGAPAGTPLAQLYPAPSAIGSILRMPEVEGIIASLTGPGPGLRPSRYPYARRQADSRLSISMVTPMIDHAHPF